MLECQDDTHITKFFESFVQGSKLFIVMEYVGGGSVKDAIKRRGGSLGSEVYISIIEHVGGGAGRREGPDDLLSFLPITSISLLAFSSTSVISPHPQMGSVSSKSSTNYQKLQK